MPFRHDDAARERSPNEQVSRRARATTPADDVLALQRSAGNQAVSAMLARAPTAKEKEAPATGPTATVESIGTIPLNSVGIDVGRVAGGAGGGKERDLPKNLSLSSQLGRHSAALARATAAGTPLGDIEIRIPHGKTTVVLTVKNAMVSSYQTSGQTESWQLSGDSIEFHMQGEDEGKGGGKSDESDTG